MALAKKRKIVYLKPEASRHENVNIFMVGAVCSNNRSIILHETGNKHYKDLVNKGGVSGQ